MLSDQHGRRFAVTGHEYGENGIDQNLVIGADGYVHLPTWPGLGYQFNWDSIREHLIDEEDAPATLGDWATG